MGVKTTPSNKGQNQRPKEPESYDYNNYEYTYFYDDDYNNGDSKQNNQGNQNRFLVNSTPSPISGNSGVGGGRGQSFQVSFHIFDRFRGVVRNFNPWVPKVCPI